MKILTIIAILSIIIFVLFPEIDLLVSRLFYSKEAGFIYRECPVALFFYKLIYVLASGIGAGLVLFILIKTLRPKWLSKITIPSRRQAIFLLLVLIIGPGVLVHQVVKETWQRARPVNIIEFGGEKQFTNPFEISNQDGKSFVSGHAAMGVYIASFAFLFSGRRRKIVYTSGLIFGIVIGFFRIAQGAHFLSDVVFAILLTLFIAHLLHWLMFRGKHTEKAILAANYEETNDPDYQKELSYWDKTLSDGI